MFVTKLNSGDTTSLPQQINYFHLHSFHSYIVAVAICGNCGESQYETQVIKHDFQQTSNSLAALIANSCK
jgi:hypothetical protein